MTRPGRGLGKDVWLPILLLSSMHWPAVDHWNLLSPWQSLTCKGNEAESPWASQVSPRSSSFPGDPPSSWEMPLPWQALFPASCILAGGTRGKGTSKSGHDSTAVNLQGEGLHSATNTSPPSSQLWAQCPHASSPMISWLEPKIHPKSRNWDLGMERGDGFVQKAMAGPGWRRQRVCHGLPKGRSPYAQHGD